MKAILLLLLSTVAAAAQDGKRGNGHIENHDMYKGLINPITHKSCCNAQTKDDPAGDCRPGTVWRADNGDLRARIGGREMSVPEASLVPEQMNPHRPVGMICERDGQFYCVAISGAGG